MPLDRFLVQEKHGTKIGNWLLEKRKMKMKKRKNQKTKINSELKAILEKIVFDANRVDFKFGHDENGNPLDYTEWVDLRNSINKAKNLKV